MESVRIVCTNAYNRGDDPMRIHIVQKGDTVGKLADKYDLSLNQIKQANSTITNPDVLMPGMKVKIPSPTVAVRKETSVKEPNKEPKKPLLNKKEKLEPLKKPATNTTELDSMSALKTLAQPPKSASYSSEPKPLPPKQACSSCGTYPKTPPHVPNQQVSATNQSISPQSMNETHYMQEMAGNSPSLMNQWSTTNESSSVESMMNSTNGNHHAPMQQGMGGNHHAPMQQGMGGNHHAPMQQGMGGNHHAPMQQGMGGNHHAPMQQGMGGNHHAPMQQGMGGNHHAPMQQGMGGNHHAPMQQGMGGNHHAPMQQGMGGNHHAPMQQGMGGNHHAPMQQGMGGNYHAPMQQGMGGNHHAPMQQGMGGNHHAPMQQGMGGNHQAPMQQGMGGNHHAPMQQGMGGNHHAPMQQGMGNQQPPPTFVKKDGQWNSANQSWFYPQMDSYAPQIEQYGHTQNEYGYREASAHNQAPQWETMHGMQASYAPYEPKEQVNNYDEKDTHED
ncbi:LysM peptidoglycan-binding domain-containing protein [Shouchella lehensis]|uniref:LysM peptidoglycan-binding domain-containing protein n=2 Tax=Shouchella lehensis TaxID=300825 RepID=A0A4Y7WIB8_9BACI|nr:LysM peptidoglycan-binding domain-containing protein [Shouchella lehensis]